MIHKILVLVNLTSFVITVLPFLFSNSSFAQQEEKKPVVIFSDEADEVLEVENEQDETVKNKDDEESDKDSRALYNEALEKFNNKLWEQASRLFQEARRMAGTDGVVRFNATYNLGWVDVKTADEMLEKEPDKALESLYRAADWFRESIALRDDIDARHNLEVVLQRAMVLADSLQKKTAGDLLSRINQNISTQREFLDILRKEVDIEKVEAYTSEQLRTQLRSLAVQQLDILSESQQLTEVAAREGDTLRGKLESEQTPEDKMRVAQIEGFLHYLHRSQERMGQARRRLRTSQIERAYRRSAIALAELKRSRDQLLDPVSRIDALLNDSAESIRHIATKADNQMGKLAIQNEKKFPEWLTQEYLVESQTSLSERVQELHNGLNAGLSGDSELSAVEDPKQKQLIENLRLALPWLKKSSEKFDQTKNQLEQSRFDESFVLQNEGIKALVSAREIFLDLRQLVEVVYQDQLRIQHYLDSSSSQMLAPSSLTGVGGKNTSNNLPTEKASLAVVSEYLPLIEEFQQKNLGRTKRLKKLIDLAVNEQEDIKQQLETQQNLQTSTPNQPQTSLPQQNQLKEKLTAQSERLKEAEKLRKKAFTEFEYNQKILMGLIAKSGKSDLSNSILKPLRSSVKDSVKTVEQLRRLFFSLVEHLRETAQKQVELGDETQDTIALAKTETKDETASRMNPLSSRQVNLSNISGTIAEALSKESQQIVQQEAKQSGTNGSSSQMSEKYAQAGQLVGEATVKMYGAASMMTDEKISLEEIGPQQKSASEDLIRALNILQPPQQDQQQDQQQGQQGQKDQQQGQQGQKDQQQGQQGQKDQSEKMTKGDMSQMLQGVRDREAQRRQNQQERQRKNSGYRPVEKDW